MPMIHWLGAGLSTQPGIRRLVSDGHALTLWNRTLDKAQAALPDTNGKATAVQLDWEVLAETMQPGDVVVSMLPASMHVRVALLCLDQGAHFVSSSYVSPEMLSLSDRAESAGLCLLNEIGLDPGIDHLMAHVLVDAYRQSGVFDRGNQHYFRSYCGGLAKVPNDFCYKFSWSPLGVLKALMNDANWIADGRPQISNRAWESLAKYELELPSGPETFESYPNRDSIPFIAAYGIESDWDLREFVRGTLRSNGWAEAWKDIFRVVAKTDESDRDCVLVELSDDLWQKHRLQPGDPDRVVLCVELEVRREDDVVWHQRMQLDEAGNDRGTAMARLVSLPVSLGVEAILADRVPAGVSAATNDVALANEWMSQLGEMGEKIHHITVC